MEPHRDGHQVATQKSQSTREAEARWHWARECLGYRFESRELLQRALTHRSAARDHNERLEFLGDAVLNFVIAARLYDRHGDAPEGDLSRFRTALVKGETLGEIAQELGVAEHLIVGPGERRSGETASPNMLANALEALLGAVYRDAGLDAARQCVLRLLDRRLEALPEASSLKDPKSRLQEWLQSRGLDLPRYAIESRTRSPHDPRFVVVCRVAERELEVSGQGPSRRGAEQEAARRMLATLNGE